MPNYKHKVNILFGRSAFQASRQLCLFNLLLVIVLIQHVAVSAATEIQQQKREIVVAADDTAEDYDDDDDATVEQMAAVTISSTPRLESFKGKQIDWGAYVNEFDMQDEAAIPEDILDQQHIHDSDALEDDSLLQYEDANILLETSRLNKPNNNNNKNQSAEQKVKAKNTNEGIRSIGPVTFQARSSSGIKKLHENQIKKLPIDYINNKTNQNQNTTAIGDIAVDEYLKNEAQLFYNAHNKQFQPNLEFSESVIDIDDKSVNDVKALQTSVKGEKPAEAETEGNERMQTSLSFSTDNKATTKIPSRSRKQRRNLPEINLSQEQKDLAAIYDNKEISSAAAAHAVHLADVNVMQTANFVSTPAPTQINDYARNYFGILKIGTNTSAQNVQNPLQLQHNKTGIHLEHARKPYFDRGSSTFEQYKAKLRNNRRNGHKTHKKNYKDYLRYAAWPELPAPATERAAISGNIDIGINVSSNKENRQRQRAQKLQAEKSRGFSAPPIFVLSSRNNNSEPVTSTKPFYEGQINYYLETKDDDSDAVSAADSKVSGKIGNDVTSWYRHVTPMLRNGLRTTHNQLQDLDRDVTTINHMHQYTHNPHQQQQHKYQHQHPHHHRQLNKQHRVPHQHAHHFSHALHHRHHQQHHHKQPQQKQQFQHYSSTSTMPLKSFEQMPTQKPNLGHQITELEDFERYYAKWPHLARVQFQVYDEHMREANAKAAEEQRQQQSAAHADDDIEYPEYEYASLAELEAAQHGEDANLPPYIRKYNRRNKQLLDLLEGPMPAPKGYHWSGSKLQPGPAQTSNDASIIRLDDDYMREKRRRYHLQHDNDNNNNNLFAIQRQNASLSTTLHLQLQNKSDVIDLPAQNNHLPDEYIVMSAERMETLDALQKEIANAMKTQVNEINGNESQMSWQFEKLPNAAAVASTSTSTAKSLVFRLPTFNEPSSDSNMRQRSRSGLHAPSHSQHRRVSGFVDSMELHNYGEEFTKNHENAGPIFADIATTQVPETTTLYFAPTPKPTPVRPKLPTMPPRSISAFVYHRVVDNTPRQVGGGTGVQGRKQQLPFVAITDRRLETFKKSLLERQKEFEQNNFPPLP